jgi:flagellar motor switch/type III secretory pathway protein FliN
MMQQIRLWLPPASRAETEAVIARVVVPWAQAWFAGLEMPVVSQTPVSTLRRQCWRGGGQVLIGSEAAVTARIGLAICAGRGDSSNPHDQAVLTLLGEEAANQLATLLGAPNYWLAPKTEQSPPDWARHCFLLTGPNREWSLALAVGDEALSVLRRAECPAGDPPRLGQLSAALARESCTLEVHLGHAQIDAAELAALAVGDVIVLDCAALQPVPLLIAGKCPATGSATIRPTVAALQVSITTPISLSAREIPAA